MAEQIINTIIVLRNDSTTEWQKSNYQLKSGEVGVGYMTRIVDGESKVVPIIKVGDGTSTWNQLPQAEGVFEQPVTLTQNFGYLEVPTGGSKRFDGTNGTINTAGMTTSEFLLSALKKTVNPTITKPEVSFTSVSAAVENADPEIGAYITALNWDGTNSKGSYKVGAANATATGLRDADFDWVVTTNRTVDGNAITASTSVDGSFALPNNTSSSGSDNRIQITSESSTEYAKIFATVTLDIENATVNMPKNNLGEDYPSGKITTFKNGQLTQDIEGSVSVQGYRKPFWGWKSTADALADPTTITSAQVRALGNSGSSTTDLPTEIKVPTGTKQVFFAVKSQANVNRTLTVKNITSEPATTVACTKKARHLKVNGANGYTAADYDLWYIDLDAPFNGDPTTKLATLSLTWA